MASKTLSASDEKALNAARCPVCGKFHPFLKICPYVKMQRVEQIRDIKNPALRGRITVTEYFPRPELTLLSIESLDEAEQILNDEPDK